MKYKGFTISGAPKYKKPVHIYHEYKYTDILKPLDSFLDRCWWYIGYEGNSDHYDLDDDDYKKWDEQYSQLVIEPKGYRIGKPGFWSFAGSGDNDVNLFTWQYFINYNLPKGWYLTSAPIITANWEAGSGDQWTIPFGGGFGKIFRIGKMPMNGQIPAAKYTLPSYTTGAPRAGHMPTSRSLPMFRRSEGPPLNRQTREPSLAFRQYRYPSSEVKYSLPFDDAGSKWTGPSA